MMEYHRLRFALFGNTYQGSKSASIQQMIASIRRYDAELYVDKEYYDFLKLNQHLELAVFALYHRYHRQQVIPLQRTPKGIPMWGSLFGGFFLNLIKNGRLEIIVSKKIRNLHIVHDLIYK